VREAFLLPAWCVFIGEFCIEKRVRCLVGLAELGLSFGGVYASLTESTKSFESSDFVIWSA
jgi:hypothetical protein